ncbi:HepT-like ribonuclease domain-containing protein [Aurantimonas sp. 22II-16-19i]|uniref:HepT-like ribonuclease domain-containing protein n=1 Tax=Aurantimonas sp. 22II-16-19i TaxID=1317114 RepID=UPI0009F7C1EF|nr:HepT-like ribonuclease domain-containing protein [Aurantimonas sp. 22II-16-19i]ORE97726.1 hypothetical protein ATO4_07300 [Aurantimonas sp. 22II-16-19i]
MVSAKDPRVRLQHILENIDGILSHTEGLAFETIVGDFVLVRAVERSIQIISEAAKELPPELRSQEPDVPWQRIIGIGSFLRHEYNRINQNDIRSILAVHLPALRPAIIRLMTRLDG